jgi:hypothetical protein
MPDRYNQLNFMLNKLIKFTCTDDIGVVLNGNCFDETLAVEGHSQNSKLSYTASSHCGTQNEHGAVLQFYYRSQ